MKEPNHKLTPEQVATMSAAKVAKCLAEHNRWRRSEGEYAGVTAAMPYSAQAVGALIDRAVELLKEQK